PGVVKPFIVGHSMGADIAGRLAEVTPVKALVLVDPAMQNFIAKMPPMDEMPWIKSSFEAMEAMQTQTHTEKMQTGMRLLMPGAAPFAEVDLVPFVEAGAKFDPNVYHHMAKMGYLFEESEVIAAIHCPILLMTAGSMMSGTNSQPDIAAFAANWRDGQHVHF